MMSRNFAGWGCTWSAGNHLQRAQQAEQGGGDLPSQGEGTGRVSVGRVPACGMCRRATANVHFQLASQEAGVGGDLTIERNLKHHWSL